MNNREKSVELIRSLSLAFGPSGCEDAVRELIAKRVSGLCDKMFVDRLGNLICKKSFGEGEDRVKIMLSAHMDEVGFMIDGIHESGMLTFGTLGGIDPSVTAGRKVTLLHEGELRGGVIASKAIHHKEGDERDRAQPTDKLYIDIGARGREEAEKYAAIGDFVTFDSPFVTLGKQGEALKGKALDDRMGCAALIEIMSRMNEDNISTPRDVWFCFTVREEIGYSGAATAAYGIEPHLALVLESTAISDLPGTPEHRRVADVGGGAVLSLADRATVYPKDKVDYALALAKRCGIAAQLKRYVSGGNDAGKIHKSRSGVTTLALSVPTRYLHSPACVASAFDYEAVRDLAQAITENYN